MTTWSLTHSTKALRWGTTRHAIFCPVWATVQTWNFTDSPFWRQSALLAILIIPKGIFWPLLPPGTKKPRQGSGHRTYITPSTVRHQPSSMTSISPWYSVWEGSTLRKGRVTFPVITVASISSPRAFTSIGKEWSYYFLNYKVNMEPVRVFLPGATFVTFSALILFPFPLEGKYSTVSPSSRLSKSPHTSLRRNQIPGFMANSSGKSRIRILKKTSHDSFSGSLGCSTCSERKSPGHDLLSQWSQNYPSVWRRIHGPSWRLCGWGA